MDVSVPLHSIDEERALLGPRDAHARAVRNRFGVSLVVRDGRVHLGGDDAEAIADAAAVLRGLLEHVREHGELSDDVVRAALQSPPPPDAEPTADGQIELPPGVVARTPGQERYLHTIQRAAVTLAIGPAGTGKTWLAAAMAVSALRRGHYKKLVLVRPAVEAGENLGFLPGDYVAKINPFLRPLYDGLSAHLEAGKLQHYLDTDVIEIAPLAYMRGRTLDQAFIILDEAQNCTRGQMKMFLTRMGNASKVVVTGDDTQIDLPVNQPSGLVHAADLLRNVKGVGLIKLQRRDIVRHPLVQRIVNAYEADERRDDGR